MRRVITVTAMAVSSPFHRARNAPGAHLVAPENGRRGTRLRDGTGPDTLPHGMGS
jgi:hypothetical protein